jgi:hypothetical protein
MRSFTKLDPVSHKGKTNVWLTPRYILDALGRFDLDPAACSEWLTANNHYFQNGLEQEWFGRIWLNPPYGKETGIWLKKLELHGNGIALVFARTDTKWFQELNYDAINFLKGRISFLDSNGNKSTNAGTPSILIAFGKENVEWLSKIEGTILVKK